MVAKRVLLLPLAVLALLAGIISGLWRAGWHTPFPHPAMFANHGPLMVCGFLGTLIGLERAVALGQRWAYLTPILAGAGAVFLVVPISPVAAPALFTASGFLLLMVNIVFMNKWPSFHMAIMNGGAMAWLIGNLLWLFGLPIYQLVLWWAGFLVLTITAERLELSRILQLKRPAILFFLGAFLMYSAGMIVSLTQLGRGARLAGAGMLLFSIWLYRYDLARRALGQQGLPRFIAICLLLGYAWLGLAGLFALGWGGVTAGFHYDALLHALFLGFIFSMIFAHAPMIFPAILKVKMEYQGWFYSHVILLHLSLILRIIGDWQLNPVIRIVGSLLNGLAILLFFVNTIISVKLQKASPAPAGANQ